VTVGGQPALVLAASPSALTVLPPLDSPTGTTEVSVTCGKQEPATIQIDSDRVEIGSGWFTAAAGTKASSSRQRDGNAGESSAGSAELGPEIAELAGGNPARVFSSGEPGNQAEFQVTGRQRGNFLISIRLVPALMKPLR